MPTQPVVRPVIRAVVGSVIAALEGLRRFVYSFDGVDDRGSLAFRAINPDGDIDIEFKTGNEVPPLGTACCVVDQSISTNFSQKEFYLQINTGGLLQAVLGGNFLAANFNTIVQPNTSYRVQITGNTLRYFRNGAQTQQSTITRGAARESTAVTKVGAWSLAASFGGFYRGQLLDVKINGTLWPIADRNQPIQLPQPSGLGAELITPSILENPDSKGTQWSYLGGGRWQYVGDGSLNGLRFLSFGTQPVQGFLEFEVESITGEMTSSVSASFGRFTTTGVYRRFYTDVGASNANLFELKRFGTSVASCIIKNISFKPLGSCNPLTLVNTNPDRWSEEAV